MSLISLTEKQDKLYKMLIHKYDREQWQKVCSLEAFIKIQIAKVNSYTLKNDLETVLFYAENDY